MNKVGKTIVQTFGAFLVVTFAFAFVRFLAEIQNNKETEQVYEQALCELGRDAVRSGKVKPQYSSEYNGYTVEQINHLFGKPFLAESFRDPPIEYYLAYKTSEKMSAFYFNKEGVCLVTISYDMDDAPALFREYMKAKR